MSELEALRVELETPLGVLEWRPPGQLQGAAEALICLSSPRPGQFGMMPDQVPFAQALGRKDSFLHLVGTIWPCYRVLADTVPDEEWSPNVVY